MTELGIKWERERNKWVYEFILFLEIFFIVIWKKNTGAFLLLLQCMQWLKLKKKQKQKNLNAQLSRSHRDKQLEKKIIIIINSN